MKCPNCGTNLDVTHYEGIEVEQCKQCGGMWFNSQEVDQLEDSVFDQDEFKGTMITNVRESEKACPKCKLIMKKFDYRWEDLELDYCTQGDGFWLDKGEETRITEIIKQEAIDTHRKFKAERQWTNTLKEFQSPSFISKIKNIIGL